MPVLVRRIFRTPAGPISIYLALTLPLFLFGGVQAAERTVLLFHALALSVTAYLALAPKPQLRSGALMLGAPVLLLPVLYAELPWLNQVLTSGFFDERVLAWEVSLFGSDLARELASLLPWLWLSEFLHVSYLSFYVLALLPIALLAMRREDERLRTTVIAFTLATLVGYAVFVLFPVQGPRYFGPPVGIPEGPVRALTLAVLESNSSRGSAFPSGHVSIMICNAVLAHYFFGRLKWLFFLPAAAVTVGVVYGGFHYAIDSLAGAVVGATAAAAALALARAELRDTQWAPLADGAPPSAPTTAGTWPAGQAAD